MPHEELADRIVSAMTDEELLAQMLMFGWAGTDPSREVIRWVEERSLGSIKIFGWNTDNTRKVAESVTLLQRKAETGRFRIPLFVATDQEGGWIRHIKGLTSETPGNLAIGASGLPSDAWYSGYYIARELRAVGINLNFAPTVDLYTDHDSTIIGPRSFGEDARAAGILGMAFSQGSLAAGVLTTAKHFPGHGHTHSDSHGKLPVIDIDPETLRSRELVPFRYLIDSGVPAIMSGHLSFPNIGGDGKPATFSPYLLQTLLREEMGFEGLIITDDMMMNGATEYAGSVSRAVQMAIEAGNNIIESSTTPGFQDTLWTGNLTRMKQSSGFRDQVAGSARRIILAKLEYFKDGKNSIYPDMDKIEERIPDREGESFFLSQAVRSVTTVRENPAIPVSGQSILIAGSFSSFRSLGKQRFPEADTAGINNSLPALARRYDTLIFCLANRDNLSILKEMENSKTNIIVVSILSPVLLNEVPWVQNALAVYSYSPWSFIAAFGALAGDFKPDGTMPLKDMY
ncbi:glycoside hydrolase family 3 protein [Brucepastera parasyntrophica]|uniref:glycoside hydrolase family 3 protein n=1 Tax=Brucepastera parasyntrophica TaxID=2880008 RepID=UPI00210DEB41|nr:glycoside hydrolase family 3 protein [Brucepastera parasyntrophica]ULQ59193.1 glycoside hydrolase family 3 protein [Brucepastera parasyntrophica]